MCCIQEDRLGKQVWGVTNEGAATSDFHQEECKVQNLSGTKTS